jgi:hypothetical protein
MNKTIFVVTLGVLLSVPALFSTVTPVSARSSENLVDQRNSQVVENSEEGSEAINFARNLAEFSDSSSNTLTQTNDQSASPGLPDLFDITDALNTGINDADLDNSNFNDVTQSNVQTIDDVGDRSLAANTGINGAELRNSNDNDISQANDQDIEDIDEGSSAENDAENNAELDGL